jgi:hypothetical protein
MPPEPVPTAVHAGFPTARAPVVPLIEKHFAAPVRASIFIVHFSTDGYQREEDDDGARA